MTRCGSFASVGMTGLWVGCNYPSDKWECEGGDALATAGGTPALWFGELVRPSLIGASDDSFLASAIQREI